VIMLDEVNSHRSLGNKDALLTVLFDCLLEKDVKSRSALFDLFVLRHPNLVHQFDGIITLLKCMRYITVEGDTILLGAVKSYLSNVQKGEYLDGYQFFADLFMSMGIDRISNDSLFSFSNMRYNSDAMRYYVIDHQIPFRYLLLRNLLLSTNFLQRNPNFTYYLDVRDEFTADFRVQIADKALIAETQRRKLTLEQLKLRMAQQERAGLEAEEFVLSFERSRLARHPSRHHIVSVSSEYANAGYDIESYNSIDSLVIDRFIEVKSYQGKAVFYWSNNERQKAEELQDNYFVYLVDRDRIRESDYHPHIISNPQRLIAQGWGIVVEPDGWKVTLA
jgi:hypothetical protein